MAVRRYDEKILHHLLDKYENSLLYMQQNQRKQTISFRISLSTLPEYFDEASLQYEVIHEQMLELEEKGYVELVWKNKKVGHILEKCVLSPEKAEEIYCFLHRSSRKEKEKKLLEVCEECFGKQKLTDDFLSWIRERIFAGESIQMFADMDHPEKLREICHLLQEIISNRQEIFWREFSVRYYRDSKAAEKELDRAARIIRQFSNDRSLAELKTDELLEEFYIYKNPSWIMIKGCGKFCIAPESETVLLRCFPGGLGLTSSDILRICWEKDASLKRIVTIENLTSFHRWQEEGSLAIYLGGYHNSAKRIFLRRLWEIYGEKVSFEHFGDIDCGGFYIWKNLCERTEIPFRTIWMDRETFLTYQEFGKKLTANDRKQLKNMSEDPFFEKQKELFACMLEQDRKLEQECRWIL